MANHCRHPIVMPLSQGKAEASAADIYEWSDGRALVATEERTSPITLSNGKVMEPSQLSSTYVFPGVW